MKIVINRRTKFVKFPWVGNFVSYKGKPGLIQLFNITNTILRFEYTRNGRQHNGKDVMIQAIREAINEN